MRRNLDIKMHILMLIAAGVIILFQSNIIHADSYGYKRQDIAMEKKKYLDKLIGDKRKVELAVRNTKKLIDTSRNKPYLPEIYLRLAELYVEQSRIEYFMRKADVHRSRSQLDQLASHTLKTRAIEIYRRILDSYPEYKARDKVRFFMAHEYRELGQLNEMVVQYRAIIKKHPKSTYVPEAYLLLGDHLISLEDLDTAKRHYKAVLNYPESSAASVARYKLAWCHINRKEFKKAISLFEEAVAVSAGGKNMEIDTYKRVDVRMESLVDMAYCYTECYKKKSPQEAMDYFKQYSWSRQVYVKVLEKLAYRYYIKKKWRHASEIYRQLSVLQNDTDKLLEYARNIFECNQSIGEFKNADKDIAAIIKALRKQKYSIHIDEKQKKNTSTDFELYARNMVTHLHDKARKNKSAENFRLAAESYELYLGYFTESQVAKEMASNYAESLFSSHQYVKAGEQYEKLSSDVMISKKDKQEKLYGAIISYYNALKRKETLNHYQAAFSRNGLISTGKRYVSDFPESDRVPDVHFNVAWITYDTGEYDDAIAEFTKFVNAYPKTKAANAAVHMVLDSYNLKEDFEGLVLFGKRILANKKIVDKKLKREVAGIIKASESKIISSFTIAAIDDWEKGKSDLIRLASKGNTNGLGEKALKALIISSKEKNDLQTLMTSGSNFVNSYKRSPDMEEVINVMITSSVMASQYRYVANYLEIFSKQFPKHSDSADFLYKAAMIRKKLGQYSISNRDFEKLLHMPHKKLRGGSDIVFQMYENAQQMDKADKVVDALIHEARRLTGKNRIMADAIIADLSLETGKNRQAAKHRKKAYSAYVAQRDKSDNRLNSVMAKMTYNATQRLSEQFMSLQLGDRIDNNVVSKKASLLEKLEQSYRSIMEYKSPDWALISCYRLSEINDEFARFLMNSPLPDQLSADQQKQYKQLVGQKAKGFREKAEAYLATCKSQANKWEVCDHRLLEYYNSSPENKSKHSYAPFSGSASFVEIKTQSLTENDLRGLHEHLMKNPKDFESLLSLAQKYISKSDYRHATLILDKAIENNAAENPGKKAKLYNALGVSCLYTGDDRQAKEAFKHAVEADAKNLGAKMNLAALMQYYGHNDKARMIYETIFENEISGQEAYLVHPRARELYYAYNNHKK